MVGECLMVACESLRGGAYVLQMLLKSVFGLLPFFSQDCRASQSSPLLISPPHFIETGPETPVLTQLIGRTPLRPSCKGPGLLCSPVLALAPGASAGFLPLHLPTGPPPSSSPNPGAPPQPGGSGEAAGVDANQRSQPRTAVAPRLTHSPKLNTHYTKLIDIN